MIKRISVILFIHTLAACSGQTSTQQFLDATSVNLDAQVASSLISPADLSLLSGNPQFLWTTIPGAAAYTIEISDSSLFKNILLSKKLNADNYTFDPADCSQSLLEQVYYWRVTAIFPTKTQTSVCLGFVWLDPNLVYVDVLSTATGAYGNKSNPLTSIQAGINFARATNRSRILVSKGTYNEAIQPSLGQSLEGGYNAATNWSRNISANTTTITSSGALNVVQMPVGATASTKIDGFTITNSNTLSAVLSGIMNLNTNPTITNNTIFGGNSNFSSNYGIYNDNSSPVITGNNINGGSSTNGSTYGIYNTNGSSPTLTSNTINGGNCNGTGAYGIYENGTSTSIINNTIVGGTNFSGISYGIYLSGASSSVISGNTISGGTATGAIGTLYGIMTTSGSSGAVIFNNRISGGNSTWKAHGVNATQSNPTIRNNLIFGNSNTTSTTFFGYGIRAYSGSTNHQTHPTHCGITAAGTTTCVGMIIDSAGPASNPIIRNNILYCSGGTTRYGVQEATNNNTDPSLFANNNIAGCTTGLYYDFDTSAAVTNLTTPTKHTQHTLGSMGNVSVDNTGNQLFVSIGGTDANISTLNDNNWQLTTNAAICDVRGGGLNLSGSFTQDFANVTRTTGNPSACVPANVGATGWSMGAYEND